MHEYRPLRYISLFSGVEAASLAWEPLGWEPVAFAEIEPFPSAVLAYRWPNVPNLGDVTKVNWSEYYGSVDLVVGGSPCQAFSLAGKREGLMDERGQLMLEYVRAVAEIRPRWFIWENVPGVLSQDRGQAFGTLLREMDELRYGMAWRVLDAQFFGVAQRRRRVFLVGCARGGAGAAASVLFEPESVSGNTTSSREKRQALAADARRCAQGAGGGCLTPWDNQGWRVNSADGVSPTLSEKGSGSAVTGAPCVLTQDGDDVSRTLTARMDGSPCIDRGPTIVAYCDCLTSNGEDVVGTLCARDYKGVGSQYVSEGKVIACRKRLVAFKYSAGSAAGTMPAYDDGTTPTLVTEKPPAIAIQTGHTAQNGCGINTNDLSYTISTSTDQAIAQEFIHIADNDSPNAVVFKIRGGADTYMKHDGKVGTAGKGLLTSDELSFTVAATQDQTLLQKRSTEYVVRRLTPMECERLQGMPDDHTKVPYRGKSAEECPDGPRYKAIGNSMAVTVMRWIGEQLQAVDEILNNDSE